MAVIKRVGVVKGVVTFWSWVWSLGFVKGCGCGQRVWSLAVIKRVGVVKGVVTCLVKGYGQGCGHIFVMGVVKGRGQGSGHILVRGVVKGCG